MKKAIKAALIIAALIPILLGILFMGPFFLPGKVSAAIYLSGANRADYMTRHAGDSWLKY